MVFLAMDSGLDTDPKKIQQLLTQDVRRVWELIKEGTIRSIYQRGDNPFAVPRLECQDLAEASENTEDFVWVVSTRNSAELTAAIPWAGRELKGIDGYRELIAQLFSEYEPLQFQPEQFYDAGLAVFVVGFFEFKHRKTAKIAKSDFAGRFDMRNGRVAGGQFYENTFAIASCRLP